MIKKPKRLPDFIANDVTEHLFDGWVVNPRFEAYMKEEVICDLATNKNYRLIIQFYSKQFKFFLSLEKENEMLRIMNNPDFYKKYLLYMGNIVDNILLQGT